MSSACAHKLLRRASKDTSFSIRTSQPWTTDPTSTCPSCCRALLRYPAHAPQLSKLFGTATRGVLRELFELTPGGKGKRWDVPNTEYPWLEAGEWRHLPCGAQFFSNPHKHAQWLWAAKRVCDTLGRLHIAAGRLG